METYNVYKTIRFNDNIIFKACILTVFLDDSNIDRFKEELNTISNRFNDRLFIYSYHMEFEVVLNTPYDAEDAIDIIDDNSKYQEIMYGTRALYNAESQEKKRRQLEPIIDDLKKHISEVSDIDKDY